MRSTDQVLHRLRALCLQFPETSEPYFHDGSAATLADVVAHDNRVRSLGLTAEQQRSVAQHNAHERIVNLQVTVVVDEPELPKPVHEEVHPRACRADHFGQDFLRDLRKGAVRRLAPAARACGQAASQWS